MKIDLDAARAARREASGEAPVIVFGGKEFTLPVELPLEAAEVINKITSSANGTEISDVFKVLLGDRYQEFRELGPSVPDVLAFFDEIAPAYGVKSLGESQASAGSS